MELSKLTYPYKVICDNCYKIIVAYKDEDGKIRCQCPDCGTRIVGDRARLGMVLNLILIYGRELENRIKNADMLLERLIYTNDDYDLLQSEDEAVRYYASVRLKGFIEEQTAYDDYIDAVVMADSMYGICLDYENKQLPLNERNSLRN